MEFKTSDKDLIKGSARTFKNTMIKTLEHCMYDIQTRDDFLNWIKNDITTEIGKKNYSKIKSKTDKNDKLIVVIGNTKINGYLLVLQELNKKYRNLELVCLNNNLSVYKV